MGVMPRHTEKIIEEGYELFQERREVGSKANNISVKRWVILGGMFCLLNICFIIVICLCHSLKVHDMEVSFVQSVDQDTETVKAEIDSTIEVSKEVDDSSSLKDTIDEVVDENVENSSNLIFDKEEQRKKVYLTFDDGPTKNTDKILDILKEYNVKATFFVIGREDEHSKMLYRRIVDEGHTLAMHSYSHNYSEIYKSKKAFYMDFYKIYNLLYETTGVKPAYYRFPGGTSNQVSKISIKKLADSLTKRGYSYFDWNVMSGDASGKSLTKEQMLTNVLKDVKIHNTSIVLMHDAAGKVKTVQMLPDLLDELQALNAEILPIDEQTPLIQHVKAD